MTDNIFTNAIPAAMPSGNMLPQQLVAEFRENKGKVGGPFEGTHLLLLTTTDAEDGETEQVNPLLYVEDGDRLLVVPSSPHEDSSPSWYRNLLTYPMVRVETGTDDYWAVAVPASGAQHDRLFAHVIREIVAYRDYQESIPHPLPVVVLERSYVEAGPDEVSNLADKLLEIHRWLRAQIQLVRAETDKYLATRATTSDQSGPPLPALSLQIRQHCLAFCQSLEFHHVSEDTHTFPALEQQYPHLREPLTQLRKEHETVARIQGELSLLLADITTMDSVKFRDDLERMATELIAHLDYEESHLIPVLAEIPMPPDRPSRR